MAISLVGTQVYHDASGLTSQAITTINAGDVVLLSVVINSPSITATGVSGGNAAGWTKIVPSTTDTTFGGGYTADLWMAKVTSAGAGTISITWSASVSGIFTFLMAEQFTAGLGSGTVWATDNSQASGFHPASNSTTVTYPSLTATGPGRLYLGYAFVAGTGSAGGTSGFTYKIDSDSNVTTYNTNVSGTVAPTASQTPTGHWISVAALLVASSPVVAQLVMPYQAAVQRAATI